MRVRDGNCGDTPEFLDSADGLVVEERDAVPEDIAMRRLDQEAALPYGEFRLSPDREDVVLALFDRIAVPLAKLCGRGPLLPIEANELALVLADWAGFVDRRLLDTTG